VAEGTDAARERVLVARAQLGDELALLEASARSAVDIPAKVKASPAISSQCRSSSQGWLISATRSRASRAGAGLERSDSSLLRARGVAATPARGRPPRRLRSLTRSLTRQSTCAEPSVPMVASKRLLDTLSLAQLYVVAFLSGTLAVCFDLSYPTLFVALAPRDRFIEGNSLVHGSRSFSDVAGLSIGGLLVQLRKTPPVAIVRRGVGKFWRQAGQSEAQRVEHRRRCFDGDMKSRGLQFIAERGNIGHDQRLTAGDDRVTR